MFLATDDIGLFANVVSPNSLQVGSASEKKTESIQMYYEMAWTIKLAFSSPSKREYREFCSIEKYTFNL